MDTKPSWMTESLDNPYLLINQATARYEQQRDYSNEGRSGTIDGISQRFVVQEHTNQLEKLKETKKLFADKDSVLRTGSYVICKDGTFIVISDVKDNDAYLETLMVVCDLSLKWEDYNHDVISYPISSKVLSESRHSALDSKYVSVATGGIKLYIQRNMETELIYEGQRFLIGRNSYKIELVEDVFIPNVLLLYLQYVPRNLDSDNVEDGIANINNGDNNSPSNPW